MLEIGTKAPNFTLPDQNHESHQLSDYQGTWVVVYFYPKDGTSGCTKEACAIAEVYDDFAAAGVTVFGISKDSPESHAQFAAEHSLPFTLLSDEASEVIEAYGAKGSGGTSRITYIVDPEGDIAAVYPNVDPEGHALQLLSDLKELREAA